MTPPPLLKQAACFLLACACAALTAAGELQHYVFFDRERERIQDAAFLETAAFAGAQLKYTWRELEREKDQHDFSALRGDWAFLQSKGKKLFIQLQETSFDPNNVLVPRYLREEPEFHGGADPQYEIENDDETRAKPAGWVARRWDPAVQGRFHKLLSALGAEFDGKIEGINLPETAVEFGHSGKLFPPGFTPEIYRDAVLTNFAALKRAFPKSAAMQYANFMPGEWLPDSDRSYLRDVYRQARELNAAVGGPDLLPWKRGQMNHAYALIHELGGALPAGIAAQEGNYSHLNPKTGLPVTIPELIDFAADYLKARYIFWCTEEPHYSQKLIPHLRNQAPGSAGLPK